MFFDKKNYSSKEILGYVSHPNLIILFLKKLNECFIFLNYSGKSAF